MPNIAAVLKEEICRLARREIKTQVGKTQKAAVQYRRDIAKLKRLLNGQEKELKHLKREIQEHGGQPQAAEEPLEGIRNLFDAIADQAHDWYGMDTLFLSEDDHEP